MGDGNLPTNEYEEIEVPMNFRKDETDKDILTDTDLIETVFGDLIRSGNITEIMQRAIFAPKNIKVAAYNDRIVVE